MEAAPKVFLDYTQEELDRNYDQRAWCPTALEHIAWFTAESARVRAAATYSTHAYGPDPDETLDLFTAGRPGTATVVFVHGGAWRHFSKDDFSFVAPQLVRAGLNCAVLNFSKLPEKRLPELVAQLGRAVEWVHTHVDQHGGDPGKLYASGYSSGAHLSAILLTSDWTERRLPPNIFKGATLISGSYDLEPAVLSARGSYISLTKEEERGLSPIHFAGKLACPVLMAYTERDTDEFKRQSEAFAAAAREHGNRVELIRLSGPNHFSIMMELTKPGSLLLKRLIEHVRETTC